MPDLDLTEVGAADEFAPASVGKHLCVIESIDDSRTTGNGDEMWGITFKIVAGDEKGREIRDNISFGNSIALKRVKLLCSRVGIDTSKKFKLVPSMLTGRHVYVDVESHRDYIDKKGKPRKAAQVGFAGFEMVDRAALDGLLKAGSAGANGGSAASNSVDDESDPF